MKISRAVSGLLLIVSFASCGVLQIRGAEAENTAKSNTFYVANAAGFLITTDQGAAGLDAGDTVTWNSGEADEKRGLIFAAHAFTSVQSALNAARADALIVIAKGSYAENLNSASAHVTLRGAGAASILTGIDDTLLINARALTLEELALSLPCGAINISAETITNRARISTSGAVGGSITIRAGTIINSGLLVADGLEGAGGRIQLVAEQLLRTEAATITASGQTAGGGIRLLSKGTTVFDRASRIEARGGSGNGGFVEVSGDRHVYPNGSVDTRSTGAATGTFLIDPDVLSIVDASGTFDGDLQTADNMIDYAEFVTPPDSISVAALALFAQDTSLVLRATGEIRLENTTGNPVSLALNNNLTLETDGTTGSGDIKVFGGGNGGITTTGTGTVTLIARKVGGTGNVDLTGYAITTANGNVSITAAGTTTLDNINAGTGNLTLNAAGSTTQVGGTAITAGKLLLLGAGDKDLSAGANAIVELAANTGLININDVGGITLSAISGTNGVTSSGDVTISTTGAITDGSDLATDITGATVTLTAGGAIGASGDAISLAATALATNTSAANGNQFLSEADSVTVAAADMDAGAGGVITLTGGTFLTVPGGDIVSDLVVSGATLGGTGGATGAVSVQSGGTVAPGNAVGMLYSGPPTLAAGATFSVNLNGTTVGTQYDQLSVTGVVDLGGATLNVALGYAPSNGDTFIIVDNDGGDAVTGTFAGLSQGAAFYVGGVRFAIVYDGGDGNDVALIVRNWRTELTLSGGNLVVTDVDSAGKADALTIKSDTTNSKFIINDPAADLGVVGIAGVTISGDLHTVDVPFASVAGTQINVNTLAGDDVLTVDLSLGNFGKNIAYDGGAHATSDAITTTGATVATVMHAITNASQGTVDVTGNSQFSYQNAEAVTAALTATNRIFTFNGGAETIMLSDAAGAAMNIDSTLSPAVTFTNPTGSLTINGGTGDDTIALASIDADGPFSGTLIANGDAGNDLITVGPGVTLTGNANHSAGLDLQGGVLVLTAAAQFESLQDSAATGTVTLGAFTLTVGDASSTVFDGTINGTGGLTKLGAGTLTLTGTNGYSGLTTVSTGALEAGNGGATGTFGTAAITNNATVIYNRGNAVTVGVAISGTGAVTKNGAGTLTLTGTNTYSGATSVNAGTLLVNGTNNGTGAVNVAAAGTLGGTGTIAGVVNLAGGGALATGDPSNAAGIGTLTMDALAATAGNLNVQVDNATVNDKAVLTGTTAIDLTNITLNVTVSGTQSGGYLIVDCAAGVSNTFAATVGLPTGYSVQYGATTVRLIRGGEIAVTRGGAIAAGGADSVTNTVVPANNTFTLTYTITNSGTSALTLGAVTITPTNCNVSTVTAPTSPVASGGGTTTLVLDVTPTAFGAYSFTVSIVNDDFDEDPYNWTTSGRFLVISANNAARDYGAANPSFTGSVDGLLAMDVWNVVFNSTANAATPAGTYGPATPQAITPDYSDPGNNVAPYTIRVINATLTINKATPAITWATPAAITYPTPLSATQLNASTPVAGGFVYSPSAGTVLNAANGQTLSAVFTPTDTANYNTVPASVLINVTLGAAVVNWSTPASILKGTVLSGLQLNASANMSGSFSYNPPLGTLLNPGSTILSATFRPSDTNFATVVRTVTLTVLDAPPAITSSLSANPVPAVVNQAVVFAIAANDTGSIGYSWNFGDGSQAGPDSNSVSHQFTPAGTYQVTVTLTGATGLTVAETLSLVVNPAGAGVTGGSIDSDGDGFSDALETALGTNVMDIHSTPTGEAAADDTGDISISTMQTHLKFPSGSDELTVTGRFHVSAGDVHVGDRLVIDVGGIVKIFEIDADISPTKSNKYDTAPGERMTIKMDKRSGGAANATFQLKIGKQNLKAELLDDGFVSATGKIRLDVPVTVFFNASMFQGTVPQDYKASGKSGASATPK